MNAANELQVQGNGGAGELLFAYVLLRDVYRLLGGLQKAVALLLRCAELNAVVTDRLVGLSNSLKAERH